MVNGILDHIATKLVHGLSYQLTILFIQLFPACYFWKTRKSCSLYMYFKHHIHIVFNCQQFVCKEREHKNPMMHVKALNDK